MGDGICYLPDFWCPDHGFFLEIKPADLSDAETQKCHLLAKLTKRKVYALIGQPAAPNWDTNWYKTNSAILHDWTETGEGEGFGWDSHHLWCECPVCGKVDIQFDGRSQRIDCHCSTCHLGGSFIHGDKGYNFDSPRLLAAYEAARTYRFEPADDSARAKYSLADNVPSMFGAGARRPTW